VLEVVAVEELTTGPDSSAFTVTDLFARSHPEEPLVWSGALPVRAGRLLEHAGYDVRALLAGDTRATTHRNADGT
jgi:hypothetical protein